MEAMREFMQPQTALLDLTLDDQKNTLDWLRSGEVLAAVTAHADPVPG